MLKTVEMIVDFRRTPPTLSLLINMNSTVTTVESFRFLGTTISQELKWDNHIESEGSYGGERSGRSDPGPKRRPPPFRRLRSLRSPPETASFLSARRNVML